MDKDINELKKKIDILWNCQFGRNTDVSNDDMLFPATVEDNTAIDCWGNEPQPVKFVRDKNTNELISVDGVSTTQLMDKISEELLEVAVAYGIYVSKEDADDESLALELADTITACVSMLEQLGYDCAERAALYNSVNKKNLRRGYLG